MSYWFNFKEFQGLSEFLDMGGYARYVWSAFGLSLVVLSATVWFTKRSLAATRERLRRRLHSQQQVQS